MIDAKEKMIALINSADWKDVKNAFISRARIASGRISDAKQWLVNNGFEKLDGIDEGQLLAADGREIIRAHGSAWALKPEVYAARLAMAIELAKQQSVANKQSSGNATELTQASVCKAIIDGQLCGGTLVKASVCPRCALGKSGVATTLTCDTCDHVTAVMRGGQHG